MTDSNKFDGKPCRVCTQTLRYIQTSRCVACLTEKNKQVHRQQVGFRTNYPAKPVEARPAFTIRIPEELYLKILARSVINDRTLVGQICQDLKKVYYNGSY